MADEKKGQIIQVSAMDILRDVLEHHDALLEFLKATYDSPVGARLGLSHILGTYFGESSDFFTLSDKSDGENFLNYFETILASIWLLDKDAVLASVRNGTYMEEWHQKVVDNIKRVAESGPPSQKTNDAVGEWLKKMKPPV